MLVTNRSSPTSWMDFFPAPFRPTRSRKFFPAAPIVFGHAVFDGDDGIFFHPTGPIGSHLAAGVHGFVGLLEDVRAGGFVVKLAGGGIKCDAHLVARFVAGGGDGLQHDLDGFLVGFAARSETAFVADGGGVAALF